MSAILEPMFQLAMPWWAFVLRACAVYFILLAMIRMTGKRTMGQFTPFDMLLVVLLGNAVQNALLGDDTSVGGGLLLAATLIALNWSVGLVSARSPKVERWIEGVPVLLGSATPSLETWRRVQLGRYRCVTLAERIAGAAHRLAEPL